MTHSKLFICLFGVAVTISLLLSQPVSAQVYIYRGGPLYPRYSPYYPYNPYGRNPFVNPTQYGFGPKAMMNFMGWRNPPTKSHSFEYYNRPKPDKMIKYGRWPAPNTTTTPTPRSNNGSANAPSTDTATDTAWRYCGAGDAFFIEGQYNDALTNYQSAQRNKPAMPEVWVRKAICLFAMGEYTRAVDCVQNGVEQNPNWKLTDYTAFTNLYGKDNPELKRHMEQFRKALKSDTKSPELNYLAGVVLALQGHKTNAKPYFKKAIAVNNTWRFYVVPFQDERL